MLLSTRRSFSLSSQSTPSTKPSLYFSTRELLMMAVLAALGGVASTYINTLGDVVHAALGLPGATQWASGLHVIWIVLSVGILRKPGSGTITGILKGAVELMSGNSHGVIILLVNLVAGLLVDFGFLLFRYRKTLWPFLIAGGLATSSNVLVFQIFATLPINLLGLSAILILFLIAFASGLLFAGLLPYYLVRSLAKAGVIKAREHSSRQPKYGWWIITGVAFLSILLAVFLRMNLRGPDNIFITGAVSDPFQFPDRSYEIPLETRQMPYRDVMTEFRGYPLRTIILAASPKEKADTLLIEATDGYSFLISFEELQTNENILLVEVGQGQDASFDIVGPQSSKAWVRSVNTITIIATKGLEVTDRNGVSHRFDPDEWVSEMDSSQIALPDGSRKLQGVPVWKVIMQSTDAQIPGQVRFSSGSDQLFLTWSEIDGIDELRVFTVVQDDQIEFALALMSGQVRLFPLTVIEVQP